jgi:site-specific DNA-cytosine methylase
MLRGLDLLGGKLGHLALFAGGGGAHLALEPWSRPVAYCENDPKRQDLLLSRMADGRLPLAPIWDDVRTLDGKPFRGLAHIITAGFPCRDISPAGRRAGLDGEHSKLWREVVRLVAEVRPLFVMLENSPHVRRHAHRIVGALAALGYDARWGVVSAADVGAWHERARWWCVAADADALSVWHESWGGGQEGPGKSGLLCRPSRATGSGRRRWATVTRKGNYNKKGLSKNSGDGLATQVGGALNPAWAEWLMGYPLGWTESKRWVTPGSQPARAARSKSSSGSVPRE